MPNSPLAPALAQIALAAVRVEAMIDFYNAVFAADLTPSEGYTDDTPLYRGTLANVPLLVCPNEVAGVNAEQSRHQLHLSVADLDATLVFVQEMGGSVDEEIEISEDGRRTVAIRDPDSNTIVLLQDRPG